MKKLVCESRCSFYKPGSKKDMTCGSVDFLTRNLTRGELTWALTRASHDCDLSEDDAIRSLVCETACEFYAEDCDFRSGQGKTPCGGYSVVEGLLRDARPASRT
jgi:hypothetical protein